MSRGLGDVYKRQVPDGVKNLWLCATGTGIGPFLSILHTDEPWQRFNNIIVCYSTKTANEMAYRDDFEALETLSITRPTCEKLLDSSFEIARKRKEKGAPGNVTCVDKANVFKAFAFFRKIFDERAAKFPDITTDYNYVDAQALDLVRRPWDFDVLVAENMFADILSDLAGGLVGGMGMAPCAEIGDHHALFQPAHGSAPDIAGQDKANPLATILSASMMLDWLGNRHENESMVLAAKLIDDAVWKAFADNKLKPIEFGGIHGTSETTHIILEIVEKLSAV